MKKALRADTFDVYGWPPGIVMNDLGKPAQKALRRYVESVAGKVYRIAYDCGSMEAERRIRKIKPPRPYGYKRPD